MELMTPFFSLPLPITMLNIFILALSLASCMGRTINTQEALPLFLIVENDKYGFINGTGHIVIEPQFLTLGEFSEGLAYARTNGLYGYIDCTGAFVIAPQFEYATPFSDGLAVVFNDGKHFYIDTNGRKAFECNFRMVGSFEDGRAIVETATKKYGVINKKGKLIIDTLYSQITPVADNLNIVNGISQLSKDEAGSEDYDNFEYDNDEVGVIDSLGNFVIPYGRFDDIYDYDNGYFLATLMDVPWDEIIGNRAGTVIIDSVGNVMIAKEYNNYRYIDGNMHCGLAKIHLYKYWIPDVKGVWGSYNKSYEGFINMKGDICIDDTTFEYVEEFSDNRAFVRDDNRRYSIINTEEKVVSKTFFNDIVGSGFKNGIAFVEVGQKWGLVDTNAQFIIEPTFMGIHEVGMIDDYFFFEESKTDSVLGTYWLVGVAKNDGSIMVPPMMQQFDLNGFKNGLLQCWIDNALTYIDKAGKIVWQEKIYDSKPLSCLNIDFMNRGHFYAYAIPKERPSYAGWAKSDNYPERFTNATEFHRDKLSVVVKTNELDTFSMSYKGFTVYVANNSGSSIDFSAQDSRLYMKVQALNLKGEWQDIEYLPSSWCGNSYHTLTLEPKYYWKFVTPVYEGSFRTKLRIELEYNAPSDKTAERWEREKIRVYSNEYDASINPGQFWRKANYNQNGIMDPYND